MRSACGVRRAALMTTANDAANAFLLVYAGLFPIVNPIGGAPIFLGLTRQCNEKERNALALRVTLNSFFLLLGTLLFGSYVLEFFGITLPVVRIAGGLVVTATGWKLLQARDDGNDEPSADKAIPVDAFYPLTMPITVGPGSIAVAITLGSQRPRLADLTELALLGGAAVAGLIAIAATIFVCYRSAEGLVAALGESGTDVLVRLSAFILLCIGIEIMWSGYSTLVRVAG
jgi:multiple antibiotic resistance protein